MTKVFFSLRARRRSPTTWLSSAAAMGLTIGLVLGPLVPPAAAQQATPTSTPQPLQNVQVVTPIQITDPHVIVTAIPTSQSIGSTLKVPTPGPITVKSCGDPGRLFLNCPIDGNTEDALQAWAIQSALQLYQLPPSDAPRLMSSARDSLQALILARLLTASRKPVSQQTPEEQTAVAALATPRQAIQKQRCPGRASRIRAVGS